MSLLEALPTFATHQPAGSNRALCRPALCRQPTGELALVADATVWVEVAAVIALAEDVGVLFTDAVELVVLCVRPLVVGDDTAEVVAVAVPEAGKACDTLESEEVLCVEPPTPVAVA